MVVKNVVFSEDPRKEIDDCNLETKLASQPVTIQRKFKFLTRLNLHAVVFFELMRVYIEEFDVAIETGYEIIACWVQSQC